MRFGVNLRGDLAKLSDQELGERLDAAIAERGAKRHSPGLFGGSDYNGSGLTFGRGPLHARIFYKSIVFAIRIMGVLNGGSFFRRNDAALYLLDCEIGDLLDEVKRRLKVRKRSAKGKR